MTTDDAPRKPDPGHLDSHLQTIRDQAMVVMSLLRSVSTAYALSGTKPARRSLTMGLPQITATGNLTSDPELRFTPSGKAVANWTIACNKKRKNEQTGEWEDTATCFLRCSIWDGKAEAVAEQLTRGAEVTVVGSLKQSEYTDKDGNKRTSYDVDAYSVALVVKAPKADRQQATKPTQGDPWGAGGEDPWANKPADNAPPF